MGERSQRSRAWSQQRESEPAARGRLCAARLEGASPAAPRPGPSRGPARAEARPEQRPGPSRRRSVNSPRVWISREVPPGSRLAGGGGDSAEADGLVWGEGTRFCTSFLHR